VSIFLTEEQELIINTAREFARQELRPRAREIDQSGKWPWDLWKRMMELDFVSITVPEECGGLGMDILTQCLVVEELCKECNLMGLILVNHCTIACEALLKYGTEEQKQKYLVPAAKGEKIGAIAMTEPGAGSDAGSAKTTAVLDGDEWVLNGSKCFCTGVGLAEIYIVAALTSPEKGPGGFSAFVVEAGTPGFEFGKIENKVGWHGSNAGELFFKNCRIPKDNILGKVDKGLPLFLSMFDLGRIVLSAGALGTAEAALAKAADYSKQRVQFGKPICKQQAIAFYLAEMATDIELARSLLYRTAALKEAGRPFARESAMCKYWICDMVERVCSRAIQIFGGNGLMKEFDVERFWRDSRGYSIAEGTSEIQKLVISSYVLK
jgi:butyryl-CoA dehydrogenase